MGLVHGRLFHDHHSSEEGGGGGDRTDNTRTRRKRKRHNAQPHDGEKEDEHEQTESLGGTGRDESFSLPVPQLMVCTANEIVVSWRVHRDPGTRDIHDVTCYKVEVRSLYLDWAAPANASTIVAPFELAQPFRDVKRRFVRSPQHMHPGTTVEVRVRAIRGPRAGLVSPVLSTRFLDGPLEIRRPLPLRLADQNDGCGLSTILVFSGSTVAALRENFKAAESERLVAVSSASALREIHSGRFTIEGLPIDHCHPETKLHDIIELQPWYWSFGTAAAAVRKGQEEESSSSSSSSTSCSSQDPPRFIYVSAPVRRPAASSFPVTIFLSNPSNLPLLKGETLPFPCWLEINPTDPNTTGDLKARLVESWNLHQHQQERQLLAELQPHDILLTTPSGSPLASDSEPLPLINPAITLPSTRPPILLLDFVAPQTFELLVVDPCNHRAAVAATEDMTLEMVAETLGLRDLEAITSLLQLSLPGVVPSKTTLRDLGLSSLFWLLHGGRAHQEQGGGNRSSDGDDGCSSYCIGVQLPGLLASSSSSSSPSRDTGAESQEDHQQPLHYAKVTVEAFPDVLADDTRTFQVEPHTSLLTLEVLVQTAFWHLRPMYHVRLETSLRRHSRHDPISKHLTLRPLSHADVAGGGLGFCLRALARPHGWARVNNLMEGGGGGDHAAHGTGSGTQW